MANPTNFQPGYSYSNWQATNPVKPLPAPQVDNDFANAARSINETIEALGDVRRSDGKLKNGIVGPDALSAQLSLGFSFEGNWAEGKQYQTGDGVVFDQVFYSARVSHTSSLDNQPPDSDTWTLLFSLVDIVVSGALSLPVATFLSDGVEDEFDLGFFPVSSQNLFVTIGGQIQEPTEYSVTDSTLKFINGAPPKGPNGEAYLITARGFSTTATMIVPTDGSVTTPKLADASVTTPKLASDVVALIDGKVPSYGRYKLEQYVTPPLAINATNLGAAMQTALDDRAIGGAMAGKPLYVPAQKIDMTDAWVFPAGIKVYWGGRHPSFKRYGDTTGTPAQPHPYAGTLISTRGLCPARVWSDRNVGGDTTCRPAFVLLGESGYFSGGFTLITGEDGPSTCWDMGLYRTSSGWTIYDPQVRGYNQTSSWRVAADFWDATWGPGNTTNPALSNGKIPSWFNIVTSDYGLTNNRTYNADLGGVSSISILGTTRTGIADASWVWAPNGLSDSHYFAPALYGEGDVALRQGDGTSLSGGADIRISYQVRSGVPAQGLALLGCNGDSDRLWAMDLGFINRLVVSSGIQFFETSDTWQSIQTAAGKPTEQIRGRINRTTDTGSVILDGQFQVNLALNGSGNVALATHRWRDQGGERITWRGFDGASFAGMLSAGPGRNTPYELQVFDTAGSFKVVDESGGVDTIFQGRRVGSYGSGKSEISTNGADWLSHETGTWTPDLVGATTAGTYAFVSRSGTWTKTARSITYRGTMTLSAITVAGTGQMRIPIPVTSGNRAGNVATMHSGDYNALALTAGTVLSGFVAANTAYIGLVMAGATSTANMSSANLTASSRIGFEVTIEI